MGTIRPENLVVLRFGDNDAHVEVVSNQEAGVRVDLGTRKWFFELDSGTEQYKLGEPRVGLRGTTRSRHVIGVFDKTRLSHVDAMVNAAIEAVAR